MISKLTPISMSNEEKYILERIERLSIEVKQNMLPKSKKRYMIMKYSRPILEICTNIINLIEVEGYTNHLNKESEEKALENSRDYLRGFIDSKEKNDRMKFLKRNNEACKYNKLSHMPIRCSDIYIDSSAIIHDNQVSYKYHPKKEDIRYVDSILLYLITYIYRRLCSKYGFSNNQYINKVHWKMHTILQVDYNLTLKKGHKKMYNGLKRIGG